MDVLIIVDIQNDFLPGGALGVPEGDLIVPLANRLQERFPLVVATQDWHPRGHVSFASSHPGKKVMETVQAEGVTQILWPDHCLQGTPGADFAPGFSTNRVEAIFRKGTDPRIDSYSAFYDNARRKSTGLEGFLRWKRAERLYFAGLAADFCVTYSMIDALSLGFQAICIEDATRPISAKGFETARKEIEAGGGTLIFSPEVLGPVRPGS
jgi:nicotinamidase/pyrazinamidase